MPTLINIEKCMYQSNKDECWRRFKNGLSKEGKMKNKNYIPDPPENPPDPYEENYEEARREYLYDEADRKRKEKTL